MTRQTRDMDPNLQLRNAIASEKQCRHREIDIIRYLTDFIFCLANLPVNETYVVVVVVG